ncbi:hypothetical protein ACEW7V_02345 [Areca yellow leaf disease phytoplasma]|uniref:hypothetical protein n=1 Tax=Areca yellow leaf disease phytoplasma TaxID=927614 RepID=UPI0035B54E27
MGKDTLLLHQKAGITSIYYLLPSGLLKTFGVIDTSVSKFNQLLFLEQIKLQAQLAVDEADVIVFAVDAANRTYSK